jgi:hypothetical protein
MILQMERLISPADAGPTAVFRIWSNLCADMCRPEFMESVFRSIPITPLYWLRIQKAQLGLLLHLYEKSRSTSNSLENFYLLLFVKLLSVKTGDNGSAPDTSDVTSGA